MGKTVGILGPSGMGKTTSIVINPDGSYNDSTNVQIITKICSKYGFNPNNSYQTVNGFTLYPQTFFCPLSYNSPRTDFSENTYAIHHFANSWVPEVDRKAMKRLKAGQ